MLLNKVFQRCNYLGGLFKGLSSRPWTIKTSLFLELALPAIQAWGPSQVLKGPEGPHRPPRLSKAFNKALLVRPLIAPPPCCSNVQALLVRPLMALKAP